METITTVKEMQLKATDLRAAGKRIGFVPTMGALHDGHLSLVREAARHADVVVVSIFVNPTQFGPNEDYSRYPRDLEGDSKRCEEAGATLIFAPSNQEMYPAGYSTYVTEEMVAKPWEGASRPVHFRGVTTIVARLFNIVQPHAAIFGQKDAQQVAVIRKMVHDLNYPVQIVVAPTLRDPDGLAMSSRNRYLTASQRQEALSLSATLRHIEGMVRAGVRNPDRLIAEATHRLGDHRRVRIIYVSIVNRDTMESVREVEPGRDLMALAAWVDEVRLIDNILL